MVSLDDLLVALKSLNNSVTRADAENLIQEALGVRKASIDWPEFTHIIEKGLTQNATAAQMYELLDTQGRGQLTPADIRAALVKYGCDSSDEAIDKMIRYIDVDGDGQVGAKPPSRPPSRFAARAWHNVSASEPGASQRALSRSGRAPLPSATQVSLQEFADALAENPSED